MVRVVEVVVVTFDIKPHDYVSPDVDGRNMEGEILDFLIFKLMRKIGPNPTIDAKSYFASSMRLNLYIVDIIYFVYTLCSSPRACPFFHCQHWKMILVGFIFCIMRSVVDQEDDTQDGGHYSLHAPSGTWREQASSFIHMDGDNLSLQKTVFLL